MRYSIVLTLLFFSFVATAEKTSFTWGIRDDLVYFKKQAQAFKADIEKETKGRIKINIVTYPEKDEKGKIATDFITEKKYDIVQDLVSKFESKHRELRVWSLPFLFASYGQLEKYISSMGADTLKKMETAALQPIDYSYSGGFLMVHGRRLDNFKQLVGKGLIVDEEYPSYEQFLRNKKIGIIRDRAKGNDYVEHIIAVADEVTMSNSVVDTVVNLTDHRVISRIIFAAKPKIDALSDSDRKLFVDKLKHYAYLERLDSINGQNLLIDLLVNRGAVINKWTAEQRAQGRKFFAQEYRKFESEFPGYVEEIDKMPHKLLTTSN